MDPITILLGQWANGFYFLGFFSCHWLAKINKKTLGRIKNIHACNTGYYSYCDC